MLANFVSGLLSSSETRPWDHPSKGARSPMSLRQGDFPAAPVSSGTSGLNTRHGPFPDERAHAVILTCIPNARVIRITAAKLGLPFSDNAL